MERFAADPTASIPDACHGWTETMAAYRFLSNEAVDWQNILAPHWAQTRQRMQGQSVVLCVQDTTELNFNGQEPLRDFSDRCPSDATGWRSLSERRCRSCAAPFGRHINAAGRDN
jgi:hypothetical protein